MEGVEICIKAIGKWFVDFWYDSQPYRLNKNGDVCIKTDSKWIDCWLYTDTSLYLDMRDTIMEMVDARKLIVGKRRPKTVYQYKQN